MKTSAKHFGLSVGP